MVTTRPPKTIVKPTALGPVANTDTKLLIYWPISKGPSFWHRTGWRMVQVGAIRSRQNVVQLLPEILK